MAPIKSNRFIVISFLQMVALFFLLGSFTKLEGQPQFATRQALNYRKHIITTRFVSEGAATGDVNRDGRTDILAGNYWFESPTWKPHLIHTDTLNPVPSYSTSFINFALDVNTDGWIDLILFDQPGAACVWYENPKNKKKRWQVHTILATAGMESPSFVDVDADGKMDIICNDVLAKKVVWLKSPATKGDTMWQRFVISNDPLLATHQYTHGLGWGDVNKDGRNDVIIKTGWWESPLDTKDSDWKFHPANLGADCANMFAFDVDEDGDADIISSSAHNYGIWWYEQLINEKGTISWATHLISELFSQSHALAFVDINNDGNPDLISGKRFQAHVKGDPGTDDPSVLYWFEFIPGKIPKWIAHQIDADSGIGNCFVVVDMNKDQRPDIVVSNKKGVFYFEQMKY
ncbi:MAG: FG-GAP repeat domain-containing protein [Chitinophagaceae bacterium]